MDGATLEAHHSLCDLEHSPEARPPPGHLVLVLASNLSRQLKLFSLPPKVMWAKPCYFEVGCLPPQKGCPYAVCRVRSGLEKGPYFPTSPKAIVQVYLGASAPSLTPETSHSLFQTTSSQIELPERSGLEILISQVPSKQTSSPFPEPGGESPFHRKT